jgi:hypothetical protein
MANNAVTDGGKFGSALDEIAVKAAGGRPRDRRDGGLPVSQCKNPDAKRQDDTRKNKRFDKRSG